MSISSAFQSAVSGLGATSRMLATTSGNLANQLTEGYAARSVELGAPGGGLAPGVTILGVERSTDPELTAMRRTADGAAAHAGLLAEATARLASELGEEAGPDKLLGRFQTFLTSLSSAAEMPGSAPRLEATLTAARDLTAEFARLATTATTLREQADARIRSDVDEVNAALIEISQLNRQILAARSNGQEFAGLEDRRDRLIDGIGAIIPIRETVKDSGRVELMTTEGMTLLDAVPRRLEFDASSTITPDMVRDAGTGALSGLRLEGTDITPGEGRNQAPVSGALAAHFEIRDRLVPEFQARLDGLAADLVLRGDLGALDPSTAPGSPGLFTESGAAFDPTRLVGLAGRLELNPSLDPDAGGVAYRLRDGLGALAQGPAGNDEILRHYVNRFREATSSNDIPGLHGEQGFSSKITGVMGLGSSVRTRSESTATSLAGTRAELAVEEGRRRGVDVDEQLQHLVRLEQAHAANAQVIQAAWRMLDQLLEL